MYHDISREKKKTYHITTAEKQVFFLGARSGEVIFSLEKSGAEVEVFGLFEGSEKQKSTLTITQHHKAPRTKSAVTIKSVVRDRAQFSFEGRIMIAAKAHGTEAHLTNNNLILSDHAHVDTKPILEILPDDVVCTHAATTGRPNDAQMQFLQMRGCTKKQAADLLVDGFTQSLHARLTHYQNA